MLPASGDEDDVDEDIEERIAERLGEVPQRIAGRVDPDDLKPLRYEQAEDDEVEYEPKTRTISVGPDASDEDLDDAVLEYLVSTTMGREDARGVRNQLVASDIVDPDEWDDIEGTELRIAVRLVAAGVVDDRERVEAVLGKDLTDDEWDRLRVIAGHFLAVGRSRSAIPMETEPK